MGVLVLRLNPDPTYGWREGVRDLGSLGVALLHHLRQHGKQAERIKSPQTRASH